MFQKPEARPARCGAGLFGSGWNLVTLAVNDFIKRVEIAIVFADFFAGDIASASSRREATGQCERADQEAGQDEGLGINAG